MSLKKPAGTSNKKLWCEYPASNKLTLLLPFKRLDVRAHPEAPPPTTI
jgi:hypothetical protein